MIVGAAFFNVSDDRPHIKIFTNSVTPESQAASIITSVGTSYGTWDMGDGTIYTDVNSISHTYGSAGTKTIKLYITGDDFTKLDRFYVHGGATSTEVTGVLDLTLLTHFTDFRTQNNTGITSIILPTATQNISFLIIETTSISGTLDLSPLAGRIGGFLSFNNNSLITSISFPVNANAITNLTLNNCNINGTLDLSNFSQYTNCDIQAEGNPNLSAITFKAGGGLGSLKNVYLRLLSLTTLDFSGFNSMNGQFLVRGNSNLTSIIFSANTTFTSVAHIYSCNITGTIDLSNVTMSGGGVLLYSNPNLTGVTFKAQASSITNLQIYNCNLTGTLDISPLSNINSATFRIYGNVNLTALTYPALMTVNRFECDSCPLSAVIPFGTNVQLAGTNPVYYHRSAGLSQAYVTNLFTKFFNNRNALGTYTGTFTVLMTGNNGIAGTYQAPAGYVQADGVTAGNDGTPASANEMRYVLENQNIDFTTTKKYKFSCSF